MKKLVCVLVAAAMAVCAFTACGKTEQQELKKVVLSEVTHSIFYAAQYVAINEGYFAEEGLEIELVNAGGADKVMTSVLTGAADIGFAGAESCIYVYLQGKEDYPKVFAQLTKCDGSFLVGRESVENFDWQSLKGSTILPGRKGGMPYMTLLYALNKNGLEVGKDVFFNDTIQFNAMTGAFLSGEGDYVTVFEPSATDIEMQGKGYILASVG
ncbi:MAG: ABC transporter substrate-binding protein, partial [Oscillospiraceae bacterium]|nr:ABC transporter substrate-binding protein [Oscillospiraceae bacterium]